MKKRRLQFREYKRRRPQHTILKYSAEVMFELELTKRYSSNPDYAVIYVDGSHSRSIRKKYSYSFVVVENNEVAHMEAGIGGNHLGLNNIAGELLAAKKAVSYAIRNKKKKVILFHDFGGIADIANSRKAFLKNASSQNYRNFINQCRGKINIEFIQVKSHSGNYFNELADLLAKQALGIVDSGEFDHLANFAW